MTYVTSSCEMAERTFARDGGGGPGAIVRCDDVVQQRLRQLGRGRRKRVSVHIRMEIGSVV